MSFLPIPSEFPLPRAVNYQIMESAPRPTYTIYIVESWIAEGSTQEIQHNLGSYSAEYIFHELQELYNEYNIHGGFAFTTDSIAMRMKSMNRVLCWFGFRDSRKFTCFIQSSTS
jgi:hypothetical protein